METDGKIEDFLKSSSILENLWKNVIKETDIQSHPVQTSMHIQHSLKADSRCTSFEIAVGS